MFDIWDEYRSKWTANLRANGIYSAKLAEDYVAVHAGSRTLETARDIVRAVLHQTFPDNLPKGRRLTALDRIIEPMFAVIGWGSVLIAAWLTFGPQSELRVSNAPCRSPKTKYFAKNIRGRTLCLIG